MENITIETIRNDLESITINTLILKDLIFINNNIKGNLEPQKIESLEITISNLSESLYAETEQAEKNLFRLISREKLKSLQTDLDDLERDIRQFKERKEEEEDEEEEDFYY
ncbi:hypothetical protein [Anaerococcus hydrogenalis]|uniref:Uncharacterized protein n=1 Tax=Anaerococcus hydrogenalis TaxID=33029 RepID=A0A2N6UL14_9FIRM|nr:hypothetical protein [Anaerococcus hydrogenalis]MDK7694454.1 hypothetical protein [Anaerococcus hydrogenalis]MDK7696232.1 hypothetical protein [Anaerococcus hydrogenalis]MDK7707481.1 hypothetical protein [Anaerococcus hydrogenalis]PMC82496.1 hypothetical protein CJ192_01840 [Anaerococcus hydrogenalis]